MKEIKNYLLGRMTSLPAWIGALLAVLEVVLHMGHASTLMLVLAVALVVTPEEKIRALFTAWAQRLRDND